VDKTTNREVNRLLPPTPPAPAPPPKSILTESEIEKRAIALKGADGLSIYCYIEHGHLAIKPPGGPPCFVHKDEKAKLVALVALPLLPPRCAHGNVALECLQCRAAGV
jgi:hypothetical protein